ncbi:MAG: HPF/RaiA family ribosome-associated protein, partial [bacterium]|nr:HPF/RaiA family ribosome-associated protein [bacterium]
KAYAEEKLMALLARLATDAAVAQAMHVDIEMSRETQHHRKGEIWKAAATITMPPRKKALHASVTHEDMYAAIDLLVEETEHELKYERGRLRALMFRGARALKRLLRLDPAAQLPPAERERNEGN